MDELELLFESEVDVVLPQVIADENKRKANELERIANEEERKQNESDRKAKMQDMESDFHKLKTNTESEIQALLDNSISYIGVYKALYITTTENENTFDIPVEYTETSMLKVYVNGWKLDTEEYIVDTSNLKVVLTKTLDVIGTKVEIIVEKLVTAQQKDYEALKGDKGDTGAIGTPLVASSVSEMTDTTRNYVNTTDGNWYYYNGTSWTVGGKYVGDLTTYVHGLKTVTEENDEYYNPDNVPNNVIVRYSLTNDNPNLPSKAGTLITLAFSENLALSGKVQLFVNGYGESFFRSYWTNEWRGWIKCINNDDIVNYVHGSNISVTSTEHEYWNPDNLTNNIIVRYTTKNENLPDDFQLGTIITFAFNETLTVGGRLQMYINQRGELYTRMYWSNKWQGWKKSLNETDITTTNNFEDRDYYCTLALFENVGVIGDSYASGCSGEQEGSTTAPEHYNLSWGQILARKNGINVTNYSIGGLSTRTFLTHTNYGLPKLLSDTPKSLYILALIRNDYNIENRGETGYIGSISDITSYDSYTNYPNTFYGNYGKIIEQIIAHAPNSKIVMMTGDYVTTNTLGTAYNNAVQEIATHYGLPCMIQLNDSYFNSDFYRKNWADGGHPSAIQYSGMALAIERMFQKTVKDNKEYFKYIV